MKKVVIVLGSITTIALLFIGGVFMLTKHIYGRQDCKAFNIDNIELRTGIDIPQVLSSDCDCWPNNKISKFKLDTLNVDIARYVTRNKFTLIENSYQRNGENSNTKWAANYDHKKNELIVEIEYKN